MRILIVEDDENKREQIISHLKERDSKCEIIERRSYQSGLKEIVMNSCDVILLDMSMPTYDKSPTESGGRPRPFGGREILNQMESRGLAIPVIVVTQFETFGEDPTTLSLSELDDELRKNHEHIYRGAVYYNTALNNWRDDLADLLEDM